ncbi:MAG TPA: YitT family protein, partial [Kaistia sp.]|nr:YitT family protein [Kaistia sp.]
TAGIAFLTNKATGLDFGSVFFVINVPFFIFAYLAFGPLYLLRSVIAAALLSVETTLRPSLLTFGHIEPILAAAMGGLLIGMGMLSLIRHQAGIGGFATAAVYLQERRGWRAGKLLMAADLCVMAAAFLLLQPSQVALSVFAVICLNIVLAFYHKPGRYAGFARFERNRSAKAALVRSRRA